jgi:hypothetical protein
MSSGRYLDRDVGCVAGGSGPPPGEMDGGCRQTQELVSALARVMRHYVSGRMDRNYTR